MEIIIGFLQFFAVLIVLINRVNSQWAIEDDGCRTPNRGVGVCIPIKDCKHILDFLAQAPTPLSSKTINELRKYQCGYEGSSVKVCCPDQPIVPAGDPLPPDVSKHRNIHLLPTKCGPLPNRNRIVGGNKTSLFEFPWMTLLSYDIGKGKAEFECGGSVINDRYILTAAHCITELRSNYRLLSVRVGEYNISSEVDCEVEDGTKTCAPAVQDLTIEEVIPHPSYNQTTFSHDIGLLRLSKRIDTSVESVKPICLPTTPATRNFNFTNQHLIVTGWGYTESGYRSDDLLKVEVPVVNDMPCRKAYTGRIPAQLTHRQLCAGGKSGQDSCAGDSGGPLQTIAAFGRDVAFVQYGIVSFGPKLCGIVPLPAVYTKVAYYLDWILNNMRP